MKTKYPRLTKKILLDGGQLRQHMMTCLSMGMSAAAHSAWKWRHAAKLTYEESRCTMGDHFRGHPPVRFTDRTCALCETFPSACELCPLSRVTAGKDCNQDGSFFQRCSQATTTRAYQKAARKLARVLMTLAEEDHSSSPPPRPARKSTSEEG